MGADHNPQLRLGAGCCRQKDGLPDLPSDVHALLVCKPNSFAVNLLASLGLVFFDCRCCLFLVLPQSLPQVFVLPSLLVWTNKYRICCLPSFSCSLVNLMYRLMLMLSKVDYMCSVYFGKSVIHNNHLLSVIE